MARKQETKDNFKHLGVSITKDFYNEIERKANLWQISKSELTRIALREYLNRS